MKIDCEYFFNLNNTNNMTMWKSKPEFKRMPVVQQTYDLDETIGVASRKKYLEDLKLRIEEAENRANNVALRNDWVKHQKKRFIRDSLTILTDS